jgi:hypothetical protein
MANSVADSVKRIVTANLKLKLLSLAVALCIWSFTALSREIRYELVLPVEVRNLPPGYELVTPSLPSVRFTLAGPSILMDGVRRSNTSLILNLRGVGPGRTVFGNLATWLKLSEGVKVTSVSPAAIEIEVRRYHSTVSEGDQQQ